MALRRAKGMVLDASDPDSVSAGSFFVNPLVDPAGLAAVEAKLEERGIDCAKMPCAFPEMTGRVKLSAAWLIEKAGFAKGWGIGEGGHLDECTRSRS